MRALWSLMVLLLLVVSSYADSFTANAFATVYVGAYYLAYDMEMLPISIGPSLSPGLSIEAGTYLSDKLFLAVGSTHCLWEKGKGIAYPIYIDFRIHTPTNNYPGLGISGGINYSYWSVYSTSIEQYDGRIGWRLGAFYKWRNKEGRLRFYEFGYQVIKARYTYNDPVNGFSDDIGYYGVYLRGYLLHYARRRREERI